MVSQGSPVTDRDTKVEFHLFNVKRLRPIELSTFDFEKPPTTASLWISEGREHGELHNKGAILGLLLDARIRRATGGHRSLDDVMRRA